MFKLDNGIRHFLPYILKKKYLLIKMFRIHIKSVFLHLMLEKSVISMS